MMMWNFGNRYGRMTMIVLVMFLLGLMVCGFMIIPKLHLNLEYLWIMAVMIVLLLGLLELLIWGNDMSIQSQSPSPLARRIFLLSFFATLIGFLSSWIYWVNLNYLVALFGKGLYTIGPALLPLPPLIAIGKYPLQFLSTSSSFDAC
jgi:hypothetical protein